MKKQFTVIMLLIAGVVNGQHSIPYPMHLSVGTYDTVTFNRKIDTVMVICQFSDTAIQYRTTRFFQTDSIDKSTGALIGHYGYDTTNRHYDNEIKWDYFYSVRELHNTAEGVIDPYSCMGCNYHDYWKHLYYLDKNKQKLSPYIIVWQSQEMK